MVLSVFYCSVFYYCEMYKIDLNYKKTYTKWLNFRFRDELQYLGKRGLDSSSTNITYPPEHNFNDDIMKKYNYPINVGREYFDRFAEIKCVDKYELGYIEIVYNQAYDYDPQTDELYDEPHITRFALYGGPMKAFERYYNEFFFVGVTRYKLIDGEMNGKGECIVHRLTAEDNGYKIGDTLTFSDEKEQVSISLKISGIYSAYQTYSNIYLPSGFQIMGTGEVDLQWRGLIFGSTPYNRISYTKGSIKQKNVVFTDFDTVYYLYGDENEDADFIERHKFDNYTAWYKLDDINSLDEFKNAVSSYDYDENLGFYQEENVYKIYTRMIPEFMQVSLQYIVASVPIMISILIIVVILLVRERKRDIKIMYFLGCKKTTMIYSFAAELTAYIFILSLLSLPGGWLVKEMREWSNKYYKELNIPYNLNFPFLTFLFCTPLVLSLIAVAIITIYMMRKRNWSRQ